MNSMKIKSFAPSHARTSATSFLIQTNMGCRRGYVMTKILDTLSDCIMKSPGNLRIVLKPGYGIRRIGLNVKCIRTCLSRCNCNEKIFPDMVITPVMIAELTDTFLIKCRMICLEWSQTTHPIPLMLFSIEQDQSTLVLFMLNEGGTHTLLA